MRTEDAPRAIAKREGGGKPVVLAFAGDVHFEEPDRVGAASRAGGVLSSIGPVLRRADVTVVNLETAVTTRGAPAPKQYVFRAPPSAFAALAAGGVDVASMANNHGMDYGEAGLRDSLAAARKARFPVIGIGLDSKQAYAPIPTHDSRPADRRHRGDAGSRRSSDLCMDRGPAQARSRLGEGRTPAAASGSRGAGRPRTRSSCSSTGESSSRSARRPTSARSRAHLVGAGADVIVGGHAHRLLGTGKMRKALVSYGLGNFVWYGSSELSSQTGVLLVTMTGRKVTRYGWEPARIVDGTPRPLTGGERRSAISAGAASAAAPGSGP